MTTFNGEPYNLIVMASGQRYAFPESELANVPAFIKKLNLKFEKAELDVEKDGLWSIDINKSVEFTMRIQELLGA